VAFLGSKLKDHGALITRYDKIMQEMRKDGTYDRILRNYTRR
jgi:ABC-type amino acid transport substrate-binding protein